MRARRAAACALLCFLGPVAGSAQVREPAAPPPGITVLGRATIAVPPDHLRVLVRLTPRNVPGDQLAQLGKSVADAMRAGGIDDAKVVLPIAGYLGPNSAEAVVGTVANPTRESVEAVLVKTLVALPDATSTALANNYQVQANYSVSDCAAVQERAVTAAIADARVQAGRVAKAAGMRLGAIVSVNASNPFPSCGNDGETAGPQTGSSDPYGPLVVDITASVTVFFAAVPEP